MWTGRRYRVSAQILAIGKGGMDRRAEHIPPGEVIKVVRGPRSESVHLVEIQWRDKEFSVFSTDLESRADLVSPPK